jgi:hypothetical protein
MKIVGIETEKVGNAFVSCYRLKMDSRTQNAYNRFKDSLRETLGFRDTHGFGDRGMMRGEGFYITSIKTARFMHIIIITNDRARKPITDAIAKYFEMAEFDFGNKRGIKKKI